MILKVVENLIKPIWRSIFKQIHWPIGEYGRWLLIKNELNQLLPMNKVIFDAGCGLGDNAMRILEYFPNNTVIGMDISHECIILANQKVKCIHNAQKTPLPKFSTGSLLEPPFPPQAFDIIINSEVLTVISDEKKTVENLARLLKPDGILIIHVPAKEHKNFLGSLSPRHFPGRVRYGLNEADLTELINQNNMYVIKMRRSFGKFAGTLWEIWYLLGKSSILWPVCFILRPIYIYSLWRDIKSDCEDGRGILCVAKKLGIVNVYS